MARQKRLQISLVCEACGARNYQKKRPQATPNPRERLELKKFCPRCNQHTIHRESR